MNIYRIDFEPMYPVGGTLIIAAYTVRQAVLIAETQVTHTKILGVEEVELDVAKVIVYLSGDY